MNSFDSSTTSIHAITFNLNCSLQYNNVSGSLNPIGLPLCPNLIWIWFLLPEHHNLVNSAISCSVPQPIKLLTKFLSCRCPSTNLQGIAGEMKNHTHVCPSSKPLPFHINAQAFICTQPLPPPDDLPAPSSNEFSINKKDGQLIVDNSEHHMILML